MRLLVYPPLVPTRLPFASFSFTFHFPFSFLSIFSFLFSTGARKSRPFFRVPCPCSLLPSLLRENSPSHPPPRHCPTDSSFPARGTGAGTCHVWPESPNLPANSNHLPSAAPACCMPHRLLWTNNLIEIVFSPIYLCCQREFFGLVGV